MESVLRPRVCYLIKTERGYGFHLHGEKNKGGQFIRKVEPGSSADQAGLKPGDRLVEVNGENIENDNHHQVSSISVDCGAAALFQLAGGVGFSVVKSDITSVRCKQ